MNAKTLVLDSEKAMQVLEKIRMLDNTVFVSLAINLETILRKMLQNGAETAFMANDETEYVMFELDPEAREFLVKYLGISRWGGRYHLLFHRELPFLALFIVNEYHQRVSYRYYVYDTEAVDGVYDAFSGAFWPQTGNMFLVSDQSGDRR